jgi:hypothetical protein
VDLDPATPWTPPVETGLVVFPYRPYRCGYELRQVSPAKPQANFHDAPAGTSPSPLDLHVTIAGNAASSVVVSWATDAMTRQTEVRFGDSPAQLDKIAHGFSFATAADRRQHEVHLCGLRPGATLYYDAGGAAGRSGVHKLTTAPAAATDVTLLVVGDSRSNPSVLGQFASKAMQQGPTAMLLSGDAVASGGSQPEWDALFGAAPDLFAEVPGLWGHGNHESLDELYFDQLALPDHGGGVTQIEQWYARSYGPLRIVVLNDTVSNSAQITGSERAFLETTLHAVDRSQTPFVVTMHHQPMYTTSDGHSSNTALARRGALFWPGTRSTRTSPVTSTATSRPPRSPPGRRRSRRTRLEGPASATSAAAARDSTASPPPSPGSRRANRRTALR